LFGWLGNQEVQPSGSPFIRYHEVDASGEPRLIEVGVPVVAHQEVDDPVRADALPAGRYVTALHMGPYTHDTVPDLGATRDALRGWIETKGIATGFLVEHYRIGPPMESDWTKWETKLAYLILDA
jgi:effector-binding domain-containing protein